MQMRKTSPPREPLKGTFNGYGGYAPDGTVETIETHISRVFLTQKFAYKQKKPVDYGFVDYTSLQKRIFFAKKELSLNRRACSGVYLDLTEIRQKNGKVFAGYKGGSIIDVFVRMKRIEPVLFLSGILKNGSVISGKITVNDILKRVAKRIYLFHKKARTSKRISGFGKLKAYKENWDDNFLAISGLFKNNIDVEPDGAGKFYEKFKEAVDIYNIFLQSAEFAEFIKLRMDNGFIRDVHGDLRMEHIAVISLEKNSGICLMDCVEFDEKFRCQDLYSDVAFLLMDLEYNGFFYESGTFFDYYKAFFNYKKFIAPYERYEREVMPFFKAYRAAVRAKIALLSHKEKDALRYFNLAVFYFKLLKKPAVILNCGLPGSGKSVISNLLARYFRAKIFSSDKIRRDLYGSADKIFKYGAYASGNVYKFMLEEGLKAFEEKRQSVIFDAVFLKRAHREKIMQSFKKKDCIFIFLYSKIFNEKEDIILKRLKGRAGFHEGDYSGEAEYGKFYENGGADYSEADSAVYLNMKESFEEPSENESGDISGARDFTFITIDASFEAKDRFQAAMNGIISCSAEKYN